MVCVLMISAENSTVSGHFDFAGNPQTNLL